MSSTMQLICYVFAFVLFVLAAAGVTSDRVNLIAAGLAFWVVIPLSLAFEAR